MPISESSIFYQVANNWVIPSPQKESLDHYYILHWSPQHLFSAWGTTRPIVREDVTYLRLYHKCKPSELRACKVVLLSFRRIKGMNHGYVLLTPGRTLATSTAQQSKEQS